MKFSFKSPVKPFILNQRFGDNQACVEKGEGKIATRKVIGKISGACPIGYMDLYPALGMKGHTGLDLHATHGQVLCHGGPRGFVEEICTEPERGYGVGVISFDKFSFPDGEYNVKIRYWHLKNIDVYIKDTVDCGDILGRCDNTGVSAGDHLHLEVKRVMKNSRGIWYNVDQDNGYFGSIDPYAFYDGTNAIDVRIFMLTKTLELFKQIYALVTK